jgi:hypothetical protein
MDTYPSFVLLCMLLYPIVSSPSQGFYRECVGDTVPIILSRHRAQGAINKPIILLLFLFTEWAFSPVPFQNSDNYSSLYIRQNSLGGVWPHRQGLYLHRITDNRAGFEPVIPSFRTFQDRTRLRILDNCGQ